MRLSAKDAKRFGIIEKQHVPQPNGTYLCSAGWTANTTGDGPWVTTITGWRPTLINELLGMYWAKRQKAKKNDYSIIFWFVAIPPATCKRRVSLHFTLAPRQRAFDPDAPWKVILDALVAAKKLKNDSPKWVEMGPVTFDRGPELATRITIENLDS